MAIDKRTAVKMVREAERAASAAASGATPAPMMVYEADGLSNRPAPDARAWYVSEGVCGFAWVNIRPANSRIAKAVKAVGSFHARNDSYLGGVSVNMSMGGQSHARKVAAAHAYASVIERYASENGETTSAYAGDRLD